MRERKFPEPDYKGFIQKVELMLTDASQEDRQKIFITFASRLWNEKAGFATGELILREMESSIYFIGVHRIHLSIPAGLTLRYPRNVDKEDPLYCVRLANKSTAAAFLERSRITPAENLFRLQDAGLILPK